MSCVEYLYLWREVWNWLLGHTELFDLLQAGQNIPVLLTQPNLQQTSPHVKIGHTVKKPRMTQARNMYGTENSVISMDRSKNPSSS
jgi:hypothetical protein